MVINKNFNYRKNSLSITKIEKKKKQWKHHNSLFQIYTHLFLLLVLQIEYHLPCTDNNIYKIIFNIMS